MLFASKLFSTDKPSLPRTQKGKMRTESAAKKTKRPFNEDAMRKKNLANDRKSI